MVDYGDWPSDWSAERAVAAGRDFSELKAAHGGLAWVEFDPASARSRLYLWRDGVLEEPTAPDGSVRSRVYEYGGGACCVTLDGLAWVDETDQQVRRWRAGRVAQVLGGGAQCRYGDLAYVDAWDALLAVEESHGPTGVVHRIVRLDADGARRVLVEGADFYAAPRAAGQGRRLAWIEWDRPHQPWTETRLGLAENGRTRCLAGAGGGESIQQPRFDPAGRLHWLSDRDGWWRPCAEVALAGRFADADHAGHGVEHVLAAHHAGIKKCNARKRHEQHQDGGSHHPASVCRTHGVVVDQRGARWWLRNISHAHLCCLCRVRWRGQWPRLRHCTDAQPQTQRQYQHQPLHECPHRDSLSQIVTNALHEPCQPAASFQGKSAYESLQRGAGNSQCTIEVQPLQLPHSKARSGVPSEGPEETSFLPITKFKAPNEVHPFYKRWRSQRFFLAHFLCAAPEPRGKQSRN